MGTHSMLYGALEVRLLVKLTGQQRWIGLRDAVLHLPELRGPQAK